MEFHILTSLMDEGALTLRVQGDCMKNVIPAGADIRVERGRLYLPGDIVTFRRGSGGTVTHRALGYLPGRDGWRILTLADERATADAPVPLSSVLGRVTAIDGRDHRPGLRHRLRALAAFPASGLAWLVRRLAC